MEDISYRHGDHICPFTGIHVDYVWSDHDRPGVLNSCVNCNDVETVPMSLRDLQAKRIKEDQSI